MNPVETKSATTTYRKPNGWKDEEGHCGDLSVRKEERGSRIYLVSTWKPDADELARLNEGCTIELTCVDVQPPVALTVTPRSWLPDSQQQPTAEDRLKWANETRDGM